jgi:glutathione S-transferase
MMFCFICAIQNAMATLTLVIGTRHLSSWSLRPWMALKQSGLAFEEIEVLLDKPGTHAEIRRHSPSGRVPVLKHGDVTVWDSLAIGEYVAELAPSCQLWPQDAKARAVARSASAEMHSGFSALRSELPMNMALRTKKALSPPVQSDVNRICDLWTHLRNDHDQSGPYLFGHFTLADCMFAPVVSRFMSYGVDLPGPAMEYVEAVKANAHFSEWMNRALTQAAR